MDRGYDYTGYFTVLLRFYSTTGYKILRTKAVPKSYSGRVKVT